MVESLVINMEKVTGQKSGEKSKLLGKLRSDGSAVDFTKVKEVEGSRRYISSGGFGIVSSKQVTIDGRERTLAEKRELYESKFDPSHVEKTLEIHRILKNAGVRTFDTLRTDGRVFYSTMLNSNGRVALSHNNKTPSINTYEGERGLRLRDKLLINNIEELCNNLVASTEIAINLGIVLKADSIFYLVSIGLEDAPKDIDFLIGDLDRLSIRQYAGMDKVEAEISSIKEVADSVINFLKKYADSEQKSNYQGVAIEIFNSRIYELRKSIPFLI